MTLLKWLDDHLEELLLTVFFSIMVLVISLQVFMRYVMDNSLSWSEELARYCFIWMVYIGISYGVKTKRHIKVDAMLMLFKAKGQAVFGLISNIIFLIFAIIILNYGSDIAFKLLQWGQKSPALQIPMGLVYFATPVGMGLACIRLIQNIYEQFNNLRTGNIETEDKSTIMQKSKLEEEMG